MSIRLIGQILVDGFALAVVNIGAVLLGYGAYWWLRPANQLAIQVPVAIVATLCGLLAWILISEGLRGATRDARYLEPIGIYVAALVWSPVIFIPLHFSTQGYVSSFSNVVGLWIFQLVANLVALLVASRLRSS